MEGHRSIHLLVLDKVRSQMLERLTPEDDHSIDDRELLFQIFANYRETGGIGRGLRLTFAGHVSLSQHFITYEYEVLDKYSNRVKVLLDRHQTRPYFISGKKIVFYDEIDASLYRLMGHDLEQYAENLKDG